MDEKDHRAEADEPHDVLPAMAYPPQPFGPGAVGAHQQRHPNPPRQSLLRRWSGPAGVVAFVTAVYTVFAGLQWRAMQDSVDVAKTSSETQAALTQEALKLARENATHELRAYVAMVEMTFDGLSPNQEAVFTLKLQNGGHTPALNTSWKRDTMVVPADGSRFPFNPSIPHCEGKLVTRDMTPEDNYANLVPSIPQVQRVTTQRLTDLEAESIPHAAFALYVYGCVWYADVFDQPHVTEFCGFYDPGGGTKGLTGCIGHNRME